MNLRELAAYILTLPETTQELTVYVDDDARLLPLSAERAVQLMYRDQVGYKHSLDPDQPQFAHHYSAEELSTLTLVAALSGEA